MPSLQVESFLVFDFKERHILLLSLEHLLGLILILLCLREKEGLKRMAGLFSPSWGVAGQSEHPRHLRIKFAILCEWGSWRPKTITVITSKITDYRSL